MLSLEGKSLHKKIFKLFILYQRHSKEIFTFFTLQEREIIPKFHLLKFRKNPLIFNNSKLYEIPVKYAGDRTFYSKN